MSLPPLTPEQSVKPRHFEMRMSLLFVAIFIPMGIHLPYFPLWLEDAGFDAREIAIILSAPMFLRVATTPLITAFADRARDRAHVLFASVVLSLVASMGYFFVPTYGLVLGVSLVFMVFWTPHIPLIDSLALSGVRRFGVDYSRLRIWGSGSFLATNLAGGALFTAIGVSAVPGFMVAGLALACIVTLAAPRLGQPRLSSPLSAAQLQNASPVFLERRFVLFMTGAGLIIASHGFLYGFGSIYWASLGMSETTVGSLWAFGVAAEIGIFLVFTRCFGRISSSRILVIAGFAAILRWVAFPVIWPAGLGVPGFFVAQSLHAISTGFVLLGVQQMIAETIPDNRFGAAQGVAFFANGFAMATVTLVSGPLFDRYGGGGFYVMAGVAALGVVAVLLAGRTLPAKAVVAKTESLLPPKGR